MTTNLQRTEVPFGHQYWALSSIFQFPTIKTKNPGKFYLYAVGTHSQHYGTQNFVMFLRFYG